MPMYTCDGSDDVFLDKFTHIQQFSREQSCTCISTADRCATSPPQVGHVHKLSHGLDPKRRLLRKP